MIEKYFKTGIRFKWTKPRDATGPTNGAIVDSRETASPLIYDGLDGQLVDPTFRLINVSTTGLTMRMQIHHAWLDYAPGRTARLAIGPYDVLTGYMSGCIIATWSSKGVRYVGHVGTINNEPEVNRIVKRTFAFAMSKDTTGFNPLGIWPTNDIIALANQFRPSPPESKIFGLVTTRGEFYSILMFNMRNNSWCVGGIKNAPPINHDQLKLFMLRND